MLLHIGGKKNLVRRFPMEICDLSCVRTHHSKKVLEFLPVFQLSTQQQILDRFYLVLEVYISS